MSSTQLTADQIEQEELQALKETPNVEEESGEIKRELPSSQENEEAGVITNPYIKYLNDTFTKNQEKQSEEAKEIAESGSFTFTKLNGEKVSFKLGELGRSADIEIRDIQRKWIKVRNAVAKVRNSYLNKDDENYQEFKIQDYLGVPLFKNAGITSETGRDEVIEILDDLNEQIYQERLEIFSRIFFGITPEQIDNEFVYKRVTFLSDIAYSVYSTRPY
ncbi:MAG: hypothetical protein R2685_10900 [Candidatus Nitrosocosmicus sp.]|nr:hypothetical protein [Candidatus Nitrosocosmicus sp.]